MAQWMMPSGIATAEVDLRVSAISAGHGGRASEHRAHGRIIQPPELLVFTWRSEFTGMQDTRVTVRLTARGSHETEIEITHELATDGEVSSHADGWGQLLGRLQAYLEGTCRST
jgi:uncharacterized protein YndB with AHSA1/START domain